MVQVLLFTRFKFFRFDRPRELRRRGNRLGCVFFHSAEPKTTRQHPYIGVHCSGSTICERVTGGDGLMRRTDGKALFDAPRRTGVTIEWLCIDGVDTSGRGEILSAFLAGRGLK